MRRYIVMTRHSETVVCAADDRGALAAAEVWVRRVVLGDVYDPMVVMVYVFTSDREFVDCVEVLIPSITTPT